MKRVKVWVQEFRDRPSLQLQWNDPVSGKRRTRSAQTADKDEAEHARADLEYELSHGMASEPDRVKWEDFRELFERERVAPLRIQTRANYNVCLNLFEELCSPKLLSGISERTISTFAAKLRERPGNSGTQAPGTVKLRLQLLRTTLRWAADQKLLAECPRFPRVKMSKRKPQPVPIDTVERLLDAPKDQQTRTYLVCAWLAGLRLGEALALVWDRSETLPWIDFPGRRIWLPAGFVKGDEDQWVPMAAELAEALQQLPRTGPAVFQFLDRFGQPIGITGVCARIRKLAIRAGLKMTYRTLRRAFGCKYAATVPAQVLQRLMRHSDIKTTMTYYANVDEAVDNAVLGNTHAVSRNSANGADAQTGDADGASADCKKSL